MFACKKLKILFLAINLVLSAIQSNAQEKPKGALRVEGSIIDLGQGVSIRISPKSMDEMYRAFKAQRSTDPDAQKSPLLTPSAQSIEMLRIHSGAMASEGGVVGGGGSSIYFKNRQPFLLDFIMVHPGFQERIEKPQTSLFYEELNKSNAINGLKLNLETQTQLAWKIAQTRLSLWRSQSPMTIGVIEKILKSPIWKATLLQLHAKDTVYLHPSIQALKPHVLPVSAVIKGHGIWIWAVGWDHYLGSTSQAGLLIHEALRYFSIESGIRLPDALIQYMTAAIMLKDPPTSNSQENLDQLFMRRIYMHGPPEAYYDAETFSTLVLHYCANRETFQKEFPVTDEKLDVSSLQRKMCRGENALKKITSAMSSNDFNACNAEWSDITGNSLALWSNQSVALENLKRMGFSASDFPNTPLAFAEGLEILNTKSGRAALGQRLQSLGKVCDEEGLKDYVRSGQYMNLGYSLLLQSAAQLPPLAERELIFQFRVPQSKKIQPEILEKLKKIYFESARAGRCEFTSENGKPIFTGCSKPVRD